jgi:hypothetical protein
MFKKIVIFIVMMFVSNNLFAVTSNIALTEGSGKYIATNSISEDAITKQVQRVVVNSSAGAELGNVTAPLIISDIPTNATFVVKTVDFPASQTGQVIWTPTAGSRFVITDIVIAYGAAGAFTLFDGTDNTTFRVFKVPVAAAGNEIHHSYNKPYVSAAVNNVLKYTTGAVITGSITVSGYEQVG